VLAVDILVFSSFFGSPPTDLSKSLIFLVLLPVRFEISPPFNRFPFTQNRADAHLLSTLLPVNEVP